MTPVSHPTANEIDAVFHFMEQCDIAEFGEPDTSREDLEEVWSELDLGRDAWIIWDEQNNIIGYATVEHNHQRFTLDFCVHSQNSPAGTEELLMEKCEERIREIIADWGSDAKLPVTGYASNQNLRIQQLYERNGFSRHNYHYRMQIEITAPIRAPAWPENYLLAAYREEDELELYRLIDSAFNWEGHTMPAKDTWRNLLFRGGRYDPQLFIMVRDAGKIIGAVLAYDDGGSGWVRQLAVHPDFQGKGLGSLLLQHIFNVLSQRNISSVGLGVSSKNLKAFQFYERNGMHCSREFIEYQKEME